jgi:hypothetical protein
MLSLAFDCHLWTVQKSLWPGIAGHVLGQVTDPSAAVLAAVEVEAVNVATGVKVKANTNNDGSYRIGYLNPGLYRVAFTAAGFRKVVREDVALRVAQLFTLDVGMELGEVNQQRRLAQGITTNLS